MPLLKELKNYRWVFDNHKLSVTDKKNGVSLTLNKVGFTSLMRFSITCMDRMRTSDIKIIRNRLKSLRERARNVRAQKRLRI